MKSLENGIFITATDTEVGKTFVSGLLLRSLLRLGTRPGYFKPVASGCQVKNGSLVSEDLLFIESFTGLKMEPGMHCPVRYLKPLAPLSAAQMERRPVDLEKIWEAYDRLKRLYSFLVVEGVGGVMVPLKENYLVLDLMVDCRLPALIVCRPALGTINHTLLTLEALKNRGVPILGFLTNGFRNEVDEAALTSPGLISHFSRVPYLGHVPGYDARIDDPDAFIDQKALFLKHFSANLIDPQNEKGVQG
jgi:dethiobiotin synthetase